MTRTPHPTEVYLEKAIQRTIAGLVAVFKDSDKEAAAEAEVLDRLASRLGVDFRELDYDAESVDEVTWYPIAEMCVVTVLRHLLGRSRDSTVGISKESLAGLPKELATEELASEVALDTADAAVALGVACASVLSTVSESDKVVLEMDGRTYELSTVTNDRSQGLRRVAARRSNQVVS